MVDGDRLAAIVAAAIQTVTAPLLARIALLEQRTVQVGRDGQPGRDGLMGPAGEKGLDGQPGRDGKDGVPGKDGAEGEVGSQGPPGLKGLAGEDGKDGKPGEKGLDGAPGRDGLSGKDGRDGIDGKDGLGFDDFDVVPEERGFLFRWTQGTRVKERAIVVPWVLDRGVFKVGTNYVKGDGVTWAGSFWIAREDTTATPDEHGEGSRAWRLAVKRGREGRHGKDGAPGPQGTPGSPGRDGTKTW